MFEGCRGSGTLQPAANEEVVLGRKPRRRSHPYRHECERLATQRPQIEAESGPQGSSRHLEKRPELPPESRHFQTPFGPTPTCSQPSEKPATGVSSPSSNTPTPLHGSRDITKPSACHPPFPPRATCQKKEHPQSTTHSSRLDEVETAAKKPSRPPLLQPSPRHRPKPSTRRRYSSDPSATSLDVVYPTSTRRRRGAGCVFRRCCIPALRRRQYCMSLRRAAVRSVSCERCA